MFWTTSLSICWVFNLNSKSLHRDLYQRISTAIDYTQQCSNISYGSFKIRKKIRKIIRTKSGLLWLAAKLSSILSMKSNSILIHKYKLLHTGDFLTANLTWYVKLPHAIPGSASHHETSSARCLYVSDSAASARGWSTGEGMKNNAYMIVS